jgi:acetylornithine deacetylase/succinyl-diaminopimelate desuccinylase family protein
MPESAQRLRSDLDRAIDADRGAMRGLLAALVSMPTENPPGTGYAPCVRLIESALEALDVEHERVEIPSPPEAPRIAVFAWIGAPGPTLYFHGHYDVVPAQSPDQFTPRVEGDTLFGRGSSDMKSGLVAMLYAAKALRASGATLERRLGLVFVPDEETGGTHGSAALAASGLLARDAIGMLLPEPTSGVIWNANRGALTLEVTVKGRAAHVGMAHQGINAFERAVAIVNRLLALKRDVGRADSVLLVGGRVDAGTNFNVVPDRCRFTIDRRINPSEAFDVEKRRLFEILDTARADGIDLDVRTIQEGRAAASPESSALGRALAASINDTTGEPAAFETCPGLLEIRFYADRGVPAFAYGPGVLAVSHGPQEFVRISRMVECAKVYALTAVRMLTS